MNTPIEIIVHHTGGTDQNPMQDSSNYSFTDCNYDHKIRFNMKSSLGYYVGYHYFIDKNGIVTQARLDTDEGAHTIGHNLSSLGICLAGNFDATLPTQKQIDSLKALLKSKTVQYSIPKAKIYPHRKFAQKTCYGSKLQDTWASSLLDDIDTLALQMAQDIVTLIQKGDRKGARDKSSYLFNQLSKQI